MPDWTWRLRPALRLLFFFFGKRLSTMRTARPDSGHVSSRPTGSLRRALNQRPVHRALNASTMSAFMRAWRRRTMTPPFIVGFQPPFTRHAPARRAHFRPYKSGCHRSSYSGACYLGVELHCQLPVKFVKYLPKTRT